MTQEQREKKQCCWWEITVYCTCPACGHRHDLTDDPDFWHTVECAEETDYEVCCPKCDHEHEVELIY